MYWIWMVTGLWVAVWLQAVAGNIRIALPLVSVAAFYYAATAGRTRAALVALLAAGLLDALLLNRALTCTLTAGGAVLLGDFWRRHGDTRVWFAQAAPGTVLGLGTAIVTLMLQYAGQGVPVPGQRLENLRYLVWMSLAGLVLMPAAALVLDACAERLHVQRYRDARRHLNGFEHEAYP